MKPLPQSLEQLDSPIATFELSDGQRIDVDLREFRIATEEEIRAALKLHEPTEPIPLMQDDHQVGTVPVSFHPMGFTPKSAMYDVRQGDFVERAGKWIAHPSLGMGDLKAIPGFVPIEYEAT